MEKLDTILLVEDDNITNFINERLVKNLNITHNIETALNGEEALQVVNNCLGDGESLPNLIFLDLNMPVMDGFEFLEHYYSSESEAKDNTKIVVLTTSTNQNDVEKVKSYGLKVINKPLTKEKILEAMSEINSTKVNQT